MWADPHPLQVESLFSLAQLLTIFHWGALSDRIGRKPVLLLVRRRSERVLNHAPLQSLLDQPLTLWIGLHRVKSLVSRVWL
jgi:hypothetical protein